MLWAFVGYDSLIEIYLLVVDLIDVGLILQDRKLRCPSDFDSRILIVLRCDEPLQEGFHGLLWLQ